MNFFPDRKTDKALHILDAVLSITFGSAAALAAAVGQLLLGGVLAALALGMYLRFKRGKVNRK